MSKIDGAISQLQFIDSMAKEDRWINQIHPLIKLFLTVLYIGLTVSFRESLHRLRIVLPIVCIVGVAKPSFDRAVVGHIGGLGISCGVLSMITLMP